ncbi:hypothetical protein HDZ31DRAFT_64695 [Schizophyllum fasciatum]
MSAPNTNPPAAGNAPAPAANVAAGANPPAPAAAMTTTNNNANAPANAGAAPNANANAPANAGANPPGPPPNPTQVDFLKDMRKAMGGSDEFVMRGKAAANFPELGKMCGITRYLPGEDGDADVPNAMEEMSKRMMQALRDNAFTIQELIPEGAAAPPAAIVSKSFHRQDVSQVVVPAADFPAATNNALYSFTIERDGEEIPIDFPYTISFTPNNAAHQPIAATFAEAPASAPQAPASATRVDGAAQTDAPVAAPLSVAAAPIAATRADAATSTDDDDAAPRRNTRHVTKGKGKGKAKAGPEPQPEKPQTQEDAPEVAPQRTGLRASSRRAAAVAAKEAIKAPEPKGKKVVAAAAPKAKKAPAQKPAAAPKAAKAAAAPKAAKAAPAPKATKAAPAPKATKAATKAAPKTKAQPQPQRDTKRKRGDDDEVPAQDAKQTKARKTAAAATPAEGTRRSARRGTAVDYSGMQ